MKRFFTVLAVMGIVIGATVLIAAPTPAEAAREVLPDSCQKLCVTKFKSCKLEVQENGACIGDFKGCIRSCIPTEHTRPL